VRIAYTQADAPFSKIAAIGGASALSALSVVCALIIFYGVSRKFSYITFLPFLLLLVPVNLATALVLSTKLNSDLTSYFKLFLGSKKLACPSLL
jgi:apolipoprotein N-acyltransferase